MLVKYQLASFRSNLPAIGILAIVYFVVARISISISTLPGSVTAIWPATGIGLVTMLLLGYRVCPGIFLGSVMAELFSHHSTSLGILTAFILGINNTFLRRDN